MMSTPVRTTADAAARSLPAPNSLTQSAAVLQDHLLCYGFVALAIISVRSSACSPGAYCFTAAITASSSALAASWRLACKAAMRPASPSSSPSGFAASNTPSVQMASVSPGCRQVSAMEHCQSFLHPGDTLAICTDGVFEAAN